MDLVVRLFAGLRERAGAETLELRGLPEPLDVAGLKRELERRHGALGSLAHVAVVVGLERAAETRALAPGDELSLLPPVSGGAPGTRELLETGLFELCPGPLDVAAAQALVADEGCGAVALFTGTARASSRGRRVLRLEYEAFEALAGPEMERIFERCRERHAGGEALRMLVRHRTGAVPVGQPAVVVAVASEHRAAALAACAELIEQLKARLPVWKKEVLEDGGEWVGERP